MKKVRPIIFLGPLLELAGRRSATGGIEMYMFTIIDSVV